MGTVIRHPRAAAAATTPQRGLEHLLELARLRAVRDRIRITAPKAAWLSFELDGDEVCAPRLFDSAGNVIAVVADPLLGDDADRAMLIRLSTPDELGFRHDVALDPPAHMSEASLVAVASTLDHSQALLLRAILERDAR